MEIWRNIPDFPGYSVSNMGRVRNDDTGRMMALSRNQYGILYVGLQQGRAQYKRSVAVLVAELFLPTWESDAFDTPIHLNGDRSDCRAENLLWRPRDFAIRYHKQFRNDRILIKKTIEDEKTGERFRNSMAVAQRFGLLEYDIQRAVDTHSPVWPTFQYFKVVADRGR
jgi:hypothetical protein